MHASSVWCRVGVMRQGNRVDACGAAGYGESPIHVATTPLRGLRRDVHAGHPNGGCKSQRPSSRAEDSNRERVSVGIVTNVPGLWQTDDQETDQHQERQCKANTQEREDRRLASIGR